MIMKKFSCLEATRLASDALERPLTWSERLRLRLHLMMCDMCSRCVEQFQIIHQLASRSAEGKASLSEEDRRKIARALKEAARR